MNQTLRAAADRIAKTLSHEHALETTVATERVVVLIYLKLLDDGVGDPSLQGRDTPAPSIFAGQAERYRWRHWRRLPQSELASFLSMEVLPYMGSLEIESPAVAAFFRDVGRQIGDRDLVHRLVEEIDGISFKEMDPKSAAEFMDYLMTGLGWHLQDGVFRTSPSLRRLMIELADPRPGDRIMDPAMGTGGLLAEAFRYSAASDPGPSDRSGPFGLDQSRTMLRIATVNLALQGVPTNNLRRADALNVDAFAGDQAERGFDVVLCDPPFGTIRPDEAHSAAMPFRSRRREAQFLLLALSSLAPGGRAAVIVPDALLSDQADVHVEMRRLLIDRFEILAVVALPSGNSLSQSAAKFSILLVRRPLPWAQRVKNVWFRVIDPPSQRRLDGERSLSEAIETALAEWWSYRASDFERPPGTQAGVTLDRGSRPPRSWWASNEEIPSSEYRLDPLRWAPVVSKWSLQDDPAELAERAAEDYRLLLDQLDALKRDIDAWTRR